MAQKGPSLRWAKNKGLLFGIFSVILVFTFLLSVLMGATKVDILAALEGKAPKDLAVIVYERLPRTILAAIVGAALSASGLAFQAVLANPLADPFIIGVAGGAAIGGTLAILLPLEGLAHPLSISTSAFIFALLSIAMTYALSKDRTGRIRSYEVLLIGVVFNAFASAVIMFLKAVVKAEKAQEMLLWLMGTLSSNVRGPLPIGLLAGVVALGLVILFRQSVNLNALSLGEDEAASVGVDPSSTTRATFIGGSLLVAAAISGAGLIGFVGLIVPHIVRALFGRDHRLTLIASCLCGASFLIASDLCTRLLFPVFQTEAPVGVLTAFIGGPTFVYLLKRMGDLPHGL